MRVFNLTPELRESLDEAAVQLLELYGAEIIESVPSGFNNNELWEYLNFHNPELGQKVANCLTLYRDTEGGEVALSELAHNLAPVMADLKLRCSQFIKKKQFETEAKRLEEELSKPLGIIKLDSSSMVLLFPHAQKRFNDWKNELNEEVPELEGLTVEEIKADIIGYLGDDDKNEATKCEGTLVEWLKKCINRGGKEFNSAAYDSGVFGPMSSLKSLLRKTYQQKQAKVEEERQRQEEEARKEEYKRKWEAARGYLYPPKLFKKARRYLTDAEVKEWEQALAKATTAYTNGDTELTSSEASEAKRWREVLRKREEEEDKRKEEADKKRRAQVLATRYNSKLVSELARFKSSLYAQRQDPSEFLKKHSQDFTYNFDHLLSRDEHEEIRSIYNKAETAKIGECMISYPELDHYITINEERGRWWLWASLYADYELDGLPSLNFYLRPFVVFERQLMLKRWEGSFLEWLFTFPLNAEEKPLGYFYGVISPDQFEESTGTGYWWQTIPIHLIEVIHQGGPLPKTVEVTACDTDGTIYKVRGFKELVLIPQIFAEWLQAFPTLEALVGCMSPNVFDIFTRHLQTTGVSAGSTATYQGGSKKERAFSLFDEGELPGSPRVKALGLTYKVCQTYYSTWKREHKS